MLLESLYVKSIYKFFIFREISSFINLIFTVKELFKLC